MCEMPGERTVLMLFSYAGSGVPKMCQLSSPSHDDAISNGLGEC